MIKRYECDGGTIAIGNDTFMTCIPNNYGDGSFKVEIYEKDKVVPKSYEWKGAVRGVNFHIYRYDCLRFEDLEESDILFTLTGRYGVYVCNGDVILEKWND